MLVTEDRGGYDVVIPIEELVGISKGEYLAFLKAYYDESIAHINAYPRILVLGGCAMSADSWVFLEKQWSTVINRYGITAYRSADCNSSNGEFAGWNGEKKDSLRKELIGAVSASWRGKHVPTYPVFHCYSLDIASFERVAKEYPETKITPYEFCVLAIVVSMKRVIKKKWRKHTLGLFFEEGQDVRPHIRKLLREEKRGEGRIVDMSFVSKADHIPLQLADMIAYEDYKSRFEGTRKTLMDLLNSGAEAREHFTEEYIRLVFKEYLQRRI